MSATYKDIQRLTGLSLATISKYFNGGSLRPKNRQQIEEAVRLLDYRVNAFARSLKSNRSRTVGIIVPQLSSAFFGPLTSDICELLRRHGYAALISDCRGSVHNERESVQFLLDKMVDGIIAIPQDADNVAAVMTDHRRVPLVLVDCPGPDGVCDNIIVDNLRIGRMAAEELVRNGHRRIGAIFFANRYTMRQRREGFLRRLKESGREDGDLFFFEVEGLEEENEAYECTMRLLSRSDAPTALFCGNYDLSLGAIMAINDMGLRIGYDISFVGCDNLNLTRVMNPRPTTIGQPMDQLAANAVRCLMERLEREEDRPCQTVCLSPKLIPGGSILRLENE